MGFRSCGAGVDHDRGLRDTGVSLLSVLTLGRLSSTWFIVCLSLVFFSWGEIYALFPPAAADFFGAQNSSSNYSFLYSSKGVASIVGRRAGGIAV